MVFLFVNRTRRGASPEALGEVISEHARWIEQRLAAGQVVQAGKWGESGGMVIYRANSREEANALAQEGYPWWPRA